MARIRAIKPEFWSTPGIETLAAEWRLLYIALWNWADDHGRGTCEARELMGFAFPRDEDMTVGDFRRGLGEIRRVFGVEFYEVGGRSYYRIPTWSKHQKIDKRAEPRYPGPEEGEEVDPTTGKSVKAQVSGPPAQSSEISSEDSAEPAESRRALGVGTGEQGNRGTGEQIFSSDVASDADGSELRPDVEALLDTLDEHIAANGNRPPKRNKTNRDAMRRLLDVDDYTPDQIDWIIRWCQADNFWQANILSAAKLREKFPQLVAKARAGRRNDREDHNTRVLADFMAGVA